MTFQTACSWAIRLQVDGTAHHRIELKLQDLASAINSSLLKVLDVELKGLYRDFQLLVDDTSVPWDYSPVASEDRGRFSFKLEDVNSSAKQREPQVVVTFAQEAALSRLGSTDFYLLTFNGTGLHSMITKIEVYPPELMRRQKVAQWVSRKLGRSAYPVEALQTGVAGIRPRVDLEARKVEWASRSVAQDCGVAFGSRFSINVFAWVVSTLISLGVGVGAGVIVAVLLG